MTRPASRARPFRLACGLLLVVLSGCATTSSTPPSAPSAAAVASAPGQAALDPALQQRFADWVASFRDTARAAGISDTLFDAAFRDARYLPRVIELDRAQPEFTRSPWDYLDRAAGDSRVADGQARLALWRAPADAAAAQYHVPAEVLVAVWGIESDYGNNYGDIPTIDALATLAVDGRRAGFARGELLAALKILHDGDIDPAHMVGSWAGAMGQTQFLPSKYLAYALDADGDGRRDIWGSMPDVLASTANFLSHVGWQPGEPWGAEVQLPPGFDLGRADTTVHQSAAQWTDEGVRAFGGGALPAMADAAILLPAGARGPAFLVGANFRAVLRYNNSTSYALAVGILSQRIAGGPGVQAPWPRDLVPLTRTQVQRLQAALTQHGFDSGAPDGAIGPATRDALRRWQRSAALPPDGYPTLDQLTLLAGPEAPPAAASAPSAASAAQ